MDDLGVPPYLRKHPYSLKQELLQESDLLNPLFPRMIVSQGSGIDLGGHEVSRNLTEKKHKTCTGPAPLSVFAVKIQGLTIRTSGL